MFQEFVNRAGLETPGLTWDVALGARWVDLDCPAVSGVVLRLRAGRRGPDRPRAEERAAVRSRAAPAPRARDAHPRHRGSPSLVVRAAYLRTNVPRLGRARREALAFLVPGILATMAQVMMQPPAHLVRTYAVPQDVIESAYGRGSDAHVATVESLHKVRVLLVDLGLDSGTSAPRLALARYMGGQVTEPATCRAGRAPRSRNGSPSRHASILLGSGPRFARDAFGPVLAFYVVYKISGLASRSRRRRALRSRRGGTSGAVTGPACSRGSRSRSSSFRP